jgi:putative hemin transport protein
MNPTDIRSRWDQLKTDEPRLRAKDVADRLGISEAELIASACDGQTVVRLLPDWEGIFTSLESLGRVMALTRNEAAVHEKHGVYRNVSFTAFNGLVVDEEIDLRIFHKRWAAVFAVPVANAHGTLNSLQFFDRAGGSVHKVYVKDAAYVDAYKDLVERFRNPDQSPGQEVVADIVADDTVPMDRIDREAFLADWAALEDTHDFFPFLRKHKAKRTDALEIARGRFAWEVGRDAAKRMLMMASERTVPVMVFVGNPGMIQIHSGPVRKIKEMDAWINVMDPDFNLHLRQDLVTSSWVVEKPTKDGVVTSLELFDASGAQIVTFFGARKPGKPELPTWQRLIADLRAQEAVLS